MGMLAIVASFYVVLVFLLASCASGQANIQHSTEHDKHGNHGGEFTLPRKLKHTQEATVKSFADKSLMLHNKLMVEASSGNKQHKKDGNVKHIKGTWREWVEADGPTKSEYFTMDYAWVRRRRPIHNKQIPLDNNYNNLP